MECRFCLKYIDIVIYSSSPQMFVVEEVNVIQSITMSPSLENILRLAKKLMPIN